MKKHLDLIEKIIRGEEQMFISPDIKHKDKLIYFLHVDNQIVYCNMTDYKDQLDVTEDCYPWEDCSRYWVE